MLTTERATGLALRIIDDVWIELASSPFVSRELGRRIDRLPDIGFEAAKKKSALGRNLLTRIEKIDVSSLPHEVSLTLEIARENASRWAREEDWYWLLFDPLGVGFYGLFAPTAYCGGFLLNVVNSIFSGFTFESHGDADRYVGLLRDYARLIEQFTERTSGQAARGTFIPKPQLPQSIALVCAIRADISSVLAIEERRAESFWGEELKLRIDTAIESDICPAFDKLIALLKSKDYQERAPKIVGIGQFEGGSQAYLDLVCQHTTLDMAPERVHAIGLERIASIRADMQKLLEEIGFVGSPREYLASIETDPAWRADNAQDVGDYFRRYINRIAPHIDKYFGFKPQAPHDVALLPESISGSMTFGYYSPPTADRETGLYIYNGVNLARNALPNVAALNYHELVPGHHFHIATQRENEALHPLRQHSFVNAYNEGWAEYAATFAGEIGMYEEPEERFGRMMMDAFLTCRLVVDTGMNALGWSLEGARTYLRENAFMPETEILSETLRYSCDLPAQSLAYKLGDSFLLNERQIMREKLGDRFDLRDFHDAVLSPGALPLPLLSRHLNLITDQILQEENAN